MTVRPYCTLATSAAPSKDKHPTFSCVNVRDSLQVVFSFVWDGAVFGNPLQSTNAAGGALIVAGVLLQALAAARKQQRLQQQQQEQLQCIGQDAWDFEAEEQQSAKQQACSEGHDSEGHNTAVEVVLDSLHTPLLHGTGDRRVSLS